MCSLPSAETYEREYEFWPWSQLIDSVVSRLAGRAPREAFVIDFMCGTGRLLRDLHQRRPDLDLLGVDSSDEYISFATSQARQGVRFLVSSALDFKSPKPAQIAICTAGLHHVIPADRLPLLRRIAAALTQSGTLLIGEEVIRDTTSEADRKDAARNLGSDLMAAVVQAGGPPDVLAAASEMTKADIAFEGEYKMSERTLVSLVSSTFDVSETWWTWRTRDGCGGDIVLECHPVANHV